MHGKEGSSGLTPLTDAGHSSADTLPRWKPSQTGCPMLTPLTKEHHHQELL